MLRKITLLLSFFAYSTLLFAQQKIYDDTANAMKQIESAVQQAKQENKYVLCQVGGNWCPWCLRFAHVVETDTLIHPAVHDNYVYIHVNWSKENKNPTAMKYLGNPARFGFPVFVILNEKGNVIHIQNSAYLEEGKGYSQEKILNFLNAWTPTAVNTLK